MLTLRSWLVLGVVLLGWWGRAASALDPHRATVQYLRSTWTEEDGFPAGQVTAFAQTPDGCLWIGGARGLVRFDGLGFHTVQESSRGVPITHVLGLATDAEGGLWVWMQGANILRYSNGRFENFASRAMLPDGYVTAMSASPDGGVLLATVGQEVFAYRRGRVEKAGSIAVPGTLILATAKTTDGRLWVGTSDNGLFSMEQGRAVQRSGGSGPKKINVLMAAPGNRLWVGTDDGLFAWDGARIGNAGVPLALRSGQVFTLAADRDGNVWAGTTRGLFRFAAAAGGEAAPPPEAERTAVVCTAMLEDREGDLWIGSAAGLQRWRDGVFVSYAGTAGMPRGDGGPIFAAPDGRVWFAPASGGLRWMEHGRVERARVAALQGDTVYSIAGVGDAVWVGGQQSGLTRLKRVGDALTSRTYTRADGLAQNSVYAVHASQDGTVWAGTLSAGLSRWKDGEFRTYTTADGLAANTVTAIAEDDGGAVWVATPNGVSVLRGGTWRTLRVEDGLPSNEVTALLRERSGPGNAGRGMWIGTADGPVLFAAGVLHRLPHVPAPLQQPVLGMAEDSAGSVWFAMPDQVLRVDAAKLTAGTLDAAEVRRYSRADGLLSTEGVRRSRSMLEDRDGRVWISTRSGLAAASPVDFARPAAAAVVQIKALLADGRTVPIGDARVPASQQRLLLQFAGVSLAMPERVRYRYRLDAFDKGWSEATDAREADYTHLDPGTYRFHLIASNGEGVWNSADTSLPFVIEPALWQTWWFRLCAAGLVVLAMWWAHRLRTLQLASQLHIRFEERLAERMRIAQDLHDTLLQGFLSASLQLDVAAEYVPRESPAAPMLRRVLALMRQVSEDCRSALMTLRTGVRFSHDLESGLAAVPQELGLEGTAAYRIVVNGSPEALEPLCSDEVFLIGREAVLNAYRHAQASLIEVELVYKSAGLHLFVRDDGIGIAEAIVQSGKEKHWGLTGMRERAAKTGAQLRIWTRPAEGTEIELIVPGHMAYVRSGRRGWWARVRARFAPALRAQGQKSLEKEQVRDEPADQNTYR
ncbi:sensor histidine kinase [Acidipila sp. EB88]|uniref:sensor histidine kinase n=1 Tax=Acidipila sp. EB88 TaxID=2305226 RepID=UPI000F5E6969|nr:sensor histidine kinase [Acidipila sp. EB88]RRA48822.1 hypothetical protein D1Y84_11525 [Acidipila sp. EB88]